MRIITVVVICIIILITVSACQNTQRTYSADELGWTIVQSPITGRYYEIAAYVGQGYHSYMGMHEVTKKEYDAYIRQKINEAQ